MDVVLRYFDYSFITNEYINWLNNPELTKYSEQRHLKHTFESCKEYCEAFHNSTNFLFAIIDSESNEHVGNINAYIDIYNGTADMGILVGKGNKGYGYIAWIKMIAFLFQEKNIRKITAGTMSENIPMLKIFEKSGMKYEYTKKDQFIYDGNSINLIGYCIFKEEYL
jgi:RimJ/RimL family protein N-acetyltransferase